MIEIYTDGASRGNPGPGGYGVILKKGNHYKEISEGFRLTTNNRMELLSVIAGLEALKNPGSDVTVYSDSKYVVDAFEKNWIFGWEKKSFNKVKNPDLWKRLFELYRKHKVKFVWIKGHNKHLENDRCDEMAVKSAMGKNLKVDVQYEKILKVDL